MPKRITVTIKKPADSADAVDEELMFKATVDAEHYDGIAYRCDRAEALAEAVRLFRRNREVYNLYITTGSHAPADAPGRMQLPEDEREKIALRNEVHTYLDVDIDKYVDYCVAFCLSYDKRDQYLGVSMVQTYLRKYPRCHRDENFSERTGFIFLLPLLLTDSLKEHWLDGLNPVSVFRRNFTTVTWEEYYEGIIN